MIKKKRVCFSFLLMHVCFAASANELPDPYQGFKVLPFDGQGWYFNAVPMEETIHKYGVKTVIEVGSWLGCSTRHIASLLPAGGKVYAVDHWKGSVEHQPGGSAYYKALPYLYEQFLSNVIHAKLTDKIIPIRKASLEAVEVLADIKPDLIYIDAGHETEVVYADLIAWYPFVEGHGILCGDDWMWDSVRVAVERFAVEKNLQIDVCVNFWRLY